jgi:hypothetical protein
MASGELVSKDILTANILNRIFEAELYSRKFGLFSKSDYEILMFTPVVEVTAGGR